MEAPILTPTPLQLAPGTVLNKIVNPLILSITFNLICYEKVSSNLVTTYLTMDRIEALL